MYRQVTYVVRITQNKHKKHKKSVEQLYVIIKSEKHQVKILSKPLIVEQQNENSIVSTNDIEFNRVQLWNYEKMKLIQSFAVDFNKVEAQNLICEKQQLTLYIFKRYEVKGKIQNIQKQIKNYKHSADSIDQNNKKKNKKWKSDGQNIQLQSEQQELSLQNFQNKIGSKIISMKEYHAY